MKKVLILSSGFFLLVSLTGFSQNEQFQVRVVNPDTGYPVKNNQLNSAWELTYGPDDSLWVTESSSYLVSKIDPATGGKTLLLDLSSKRNFGTGISNWPQGGLMGMALDPSMNEEWPAPSRPWVFLAYVFRDLGCVTSKNGQDSGCFFKTRIVRYEYDRPSHHLVNPLVITEALNGSTDHNSGRLTIGKVDGSAYLFYTIGDMGTGQFKNLNRTNYAQTRDSLEGKVLRFRLDPVGPAGEVSSWIPDDNPFRDSKGNPTSVWSWGHRNAQGLVFGSNGILYSSEQQDMSDDEVNIIEKGGNYGWPLVSGYCDGNYNGYTLANRGVVSEQQDSIDFDLKPPLYTLFTATNPGPLYGTSNQTWPTVACSSIDVYENTAIPGWNRSLLIPSLKAGRVERLLLDPSGTSVVDTSSIPQMRLYNHARLRDLCVSRDGLKIFVSCDMSSQDPYYRGRILEFTYSGPTQVMSISKTPYKYIRNTVIQVFPNPATRVIQVHSVSKVNRPLRYLFYDIAGKRLAGGESKQDYFLINTERFPPGIYILKLFNAYDLLLDTRKVIIR